MGRCALDREVFIIEVFFFIIMDKTWGAPDVILIVVATCDLIKGIS